MWRAGVRERKESKMTDGDRENYSWCTCYGRKIMSSSGEVKFEMFARL